MIEGRVLIILAYFERPVLIRNALNSIKASHKHYQNWELAFCDDGSLKPGEPVAREILGEFVDRIRFYNTNSTTEEKMKHGGRTGEMYNQAIRDSDAEYAIIVCDDDELHPEYLKKLADYFKKNPRVNYCYSKVIPYNPLIQTAHDAIHSPIKLNVAPCYLNNYNEPTNCSGKVDSAQVAWRTLCNKKLGAWYTSPASTCLDLKFYNSLFDAAKDGHPTGFVAQFKGFHEKQLGVITCHSAWTTRNVDK